MEKVSEVNKFEAGDVLLVVNGPVKAIGVSSANLTPNENGIIPLSNQSAMIFESPEQGIQEAPVETLDLGGESPVEQQIGEAVYNDTIGADPLGVADTSSLGGFNFSSPANEEATFEPEVQEAEEATTGVEDIEMPEMPGEVLAQEPDPNNVNDDIFASVQANEAPVEETVTEDAQEPIENPIEGMEDLGTVEETASEEPAVEETYESEPQMDVTPNEEPVAEDFTVSTEEIEAKGLNLLGEVEELRNKINSVIDEFKNDVAMKLEEPGETLTEEVAEEASIESNNESDKFTVQQAVEALQLPTQGEEETPEVPTAGPASGSAENLPELPEISAGPEMTAPSAVTQEVEDPLMAAALTQITNMGSGSQDMNDIPIIDDGHIQGGKFLQ